MNKTVVKSSLHLRAGEVVEVRSTAEILATLDANGKLDELPFMPEMLQYCGKRLRVYKRADKTCDTVNPWSLRRLKNTVHLEENRCSGEAHGGCQASCLLFWKEAWLHRVEQESSPALEGNRPTGFTMEMLFHKTLVSSIPGVPDEDIFSCQATELERFTNPLPLWDFRQYVRDVVTGNVPFSMVVKGVLVALFNSFQRFRKGGEYPMWFRSHARPITGKTPVVTLGLKPGEFVQIKNRDEILKTLDVRERNRGLSFDREMVKYCGGKFRVRSRVEKIINEKTGKMMKLPNDCIVLEGVVCVGDLHWFCPRSIYPYWREIWLERAE